jgi:hypothetical protein
VNPKAFSTAWVVTLGRLAERYHMLPSQVALHGTTFDMMVVDVLATYDANEQQKGKAPKQTSNYKQSDLETMMVKAGVDRYKQKSKE